MNAANQEDLELVKASQGGDRRAFGQLMRRYQRKMYSVAFGVLRSREDALDVVQEALVKIYRNIDRFEGNSSFYTWIYRIVRNACIDHMRRKNRKREVEFDEAFEQTSGGDVAAGLYALVGDVGDPGQGVERREIRESFQYGLDQLSENHRTVIVLRETQGMSYEEMASVMECSKGTIMSRLFHARRKMQAILKERLGLGVPTEAGEESRAQAGSPAISTSPSEVRA